MTTGPFTINRQISDRTEVEPVTDAAQSASIGVVSGGAEHEGRRVDYLQSAYGAGGRAMIQDALAGLGALQ